MPTFKDPRVLWRLSFPAGLFVLEAIVFHSTLAPHIGGSVALLGVLVWLTVFLFGCVVKYSAVLQEFIDRLAGSSVRVSFLTAHFAALALLPFLTQSIVHARPDPFPAVVMFVLWYLALGAAAICGLLAFVRLSAIRDIIRRTRLLWLYAAAGAVAANWIVSRPAAAELDSGLWSLGERVTFALVKVLLRPFVAHVVADPATARIGTERFSVVIATGCSGIEGVGLMLIFSAAWLWLFRDELQFPRSLLLMPASVALIFLLNSVRLAGLILIGHAGARQIAMGGFHSDAGWIFFICVAIGLLYTAQSTRFGRSAAVAGGDPMPLPMSLNDAKLPIASGTFTEENSTAVYLAPLVVILATAMITRAASAEFDWLYPLRFLAAAAVFWVYRRKYFDLDWRFSGQSVLLGAAVFLLWIIPLPWSATPGTSLGAALDLLPRWNRDLWLIFRVLGAMLTVPLAEELAFRGFALRRLQTVDFESVNWRAFTWPALLISSLIFGIMHGERWIVGTIAGLIYAAAMLRRGRIGDAAMAHATSNALLAAWVITRGAWYLW